MKKLCFVIAFTLIISSSVFVFAEPGKNGKGNDKGNRVEQQIDNLSNDLLSTDNGFIDKIRKERKQQLREQYSANELEKVRKAGMDIAAEDPTVKILDVDSIISKDKKFKFDTPPVIKGNRTLIPVRAITEGLGAELSWDQETQQVTIIKDGITINLTLGSNIAYVNGVEVALDTTTNMMNNRTYVPMRFIMETFKLKVTYDDGTIEVEDPADDTTSGGAIETPGDTTTTDGAIENPVEDDTTTDDTTETPVEDETTTDSAIE